VAARPANSSAILAILREEDRATVLRWLSMLGMEPDELHAVPPLDQVVNMIACLSMAAQMTALSREAAFRQAATALGQGDLLRTWYRWQKNAL
jgi:hypothetical protein